MEWGVTRGVRPRPKTWNHVGATASIIAVQVLRLLAGSGVGELVLAATYAQLGRLEEARAEAKAFLEFVPDFSVSRWINNEPYIDPAERERYTQGLLMAGLPD